MPSIHTGIALNGDTVSWIAVAHQEVTPELIDALKHEAALFMHAKPLHAACKAFEAAAEAGDTSQRLRQMTIIASLTRAVDVMDVQQAERPMDDVPKARTKEEKLQDAEDRGRRLQQKCDAADRVMYEIARAIQRGALNARSAIYDAMLDYLEVGNPGGPSSVVEWMLGMDARMRKEGRGPSSSKSVPQ